MIFRATVIWVLLLGVAVLNGTEGLQVARGIVHECILCSN